MPSSHLPLWVVRFVAYSRASPHERFACECRSIRTDPRRATTPGMTGPCDPRHAGGARETCTRFFFQPEPTSRVTSSTSSRYRVTKKSVSEYMWTLDHGLHAASVCGDARQGAAIIFFRTNPQPAKLEPSSCTTRGGRPHRHPVRCLSWTREMRST